MTREQLRDLWAQLGADLQALRPAFGGSSLGTKAREYFDEYLSSNEFGLALETLCDFLLDSDLNTSESLLAEIQRLHTKMGVDDNCVRRLRERAKP